MKVVNVTIGLLPSIVLSTIEANVPTAHVTGAERPIKQELCHQALHGMVPNEIDKTLHVIK